MQTPQISAYIPCYNDEATLELAIGSVKQQTCPVAELFVVDDGSTDGSVELAEKMGVTVHRLSRNMGRGAVRREAMLKAAHEIVLCCDSSKSLALDFVEKGLKWFDQESVAAVCGRILQPPATNAVERWRGRHLLRTGLPSALSFGTFISAGALVRKSAVVQAGNFDASLTHSEDRELGDRLTSAGYKIVDDPHMVVFCNQTNNLWQLLERYWRWNGGIRQEANLRDYFKQIYFSFKVMAMDDLKEKDPAGIPISLVSPHYQFWRSKLAP